jgi:putative tryptophan/tyrosine transport system substrate-binding protein
MVKKDDRGLIVNGTPFLNLHRKHIRDLAARHRIPAMYPFRNWVEAGGLMSYGADISVFMRRTASFVDKILKGAKPGDLPIEQPTNFELVINLKTVKALGLTIPPSLLTRADQVIEWRPSRFRRFQTARASWQIVLRQNLVLGQSHSGLRGRPQRAEAQLI